MGMLMKASDFHLQKLPFQSLKSCGSILSQSAFLKVLSSVVLQTQLTLQVLALSISSVTMASAFIKGQLQASEQIMLLKQQAHNQGSWQRALTNLKTWLPISQSSASTSTMMSPAWQCQLIAKWRLWRANILSFCQMNDALSFNSWFEEEYLSRLTLVSSSDWSSTKAMRQLLQFCLSTESSIRLKDQPRLRPTTVTQIGNSSPIELRLYFLSQQKYSACRKSWLRGSWLREQAKQTSSCFAVDFFTFRIVAGRLAGCCIFLTISSSSETDLFRISCTGFSFAIGIGSLVNTTWPFD